MSRPRLDLEPVYGKLTVVCDLGGHHALVRCECGTLKWVLRTNLRAGRIKSCGKPACRVYTGTPTAPHKTIAGPNWLPRDAIPGLVAYCQTPEDVAQIADELQVPSSLISALLHDIQVYGGVEGYLAHLTRMDAPAPQPDTPKQPVVTLAPGEVAQPPSVYQAEH